MKGYENWKEPPKFCKKPKKESPPFINKDLGALAPS